MAAPLGPPPGSATTSTFPSGVTRDSVRRLISTSSTLPSGIAIGPSGNCSPVATTVTSLIVATATPLVRRVPGRRYYCRRGPESRACSSTVPVAACGRLMPEADHWCRRSGEAGDGAGGVGLLEPGDLLGRQLDRQRGDGVVEVVR